MTEDRAQPCKRCRGKGILVVDNGLHYTDCPDCNPSYAEYRERKAAAAIQKASQ